MPKSSLCLPGWAQPEPGNPFAARAIAYTIVTPDIDASIFFYRDVMGNDLLEQGALEDPLPRVYGAGYSGRRFALLRHCEHVEQERGVIRLLEAPEGAEANRPRPTTRISDPGLISIECHPTDWKAAFETMARHKVQMIAPPLYYFAGDPEAPRFYSIMYSAFGPAGEQLFISSHPSRPKTFDGLYGPFVSNTLACLDRWPVWDFYDAVFGLKSAYDKYVGEEIINYKAVNTAIGASPGSYFQFGGMGTDLTMEWWEFRDRDPTKVPPRSTNLDRTGLAMMTIIVDDLHVVRSRAEASQLPIIGQGAFPLPGRTHGDAFFLRGGAGELIEVIARS